MGDYEPDEWTWPDAYDRDDGDAYGDPPGRGCMNCGMCESCIDRSIAAAEEEEPLECSRCPAFIWSEESLATGVCHGCRSPGPQFVVTESANNTDGGRG